MNLSLIVSTFLLTLCLFFLAQTNTQQPPWTSTLSIEPKLETQKTETSNHFVNLAFLAQTNTQQRPSTCPLSVEPKVETQKTEPINYFINSKWFKVLGLIGFVSLIGLTFLHHNRPKTSSQVNNHDSEEENYFG